MNWYARLVCCHVPACPVFRCRCCVFFFMLGWGGGFHAVCVLHACQVLRKERNNYSGMWTTFTLRAHGLWSIFTQTLSHTHLPTQTKRYPCRVQFSARVYVVHIVCSVVLGYPTLMHRSCTNIWGTTHDRVYIWYILARLMASCCCCAPCGAI